jgi:hypothetical protein
MKVTRPGRKGRVGFKPVPKYLKTREGFNCLLRQGMKAEGTAHKHAAHESNGHRDEMKPLHSDYGFDEPI